MKKNGDMIRIKSILKDVSLMGALLGAILFWLIGMYLMWKGYSLTKRMRIAGIRMLKDSEHEKGKDNSASIARAIEGKILGHIPSYLVHVVMDVLGALFLVVGFVALAFYVH
jgi:hypothetical protein